MIIFDGYQAAAVREALLKPAVLELKARGLELNLAAILFTEDAGSQLYTRLKKEAAQRVGIGYQVHHFSLGDDVKLVLRKLHALNNDPKVTGIIIQKPGKQTWIQTQPAFVTSEVATIVFGSWWQSLVSQIAETKDVDGLHPHTLQAIQTGEWQLQGKVMPATAKAVLEILKIAAQKLSWDASFQNKKIVILGKSDIVGKPLFYELLNKKCNVEMIGSKELNEKIEQKMYLFNYDIVISSTGRSKLLNGSFLQESTVVIDVGEPKADVDPSNLESKVAFLTPVPGGVGPMTVISLLENAVQLNS